MKKIIKDITEARVKASNLVYNTMETKEKLYSILDHDTGNYMATGSNSKTPQEASLALFDYMEQDFIEEDKEHWKKEAENNPYEFANSFNFEIQETDSPISYDN